MKDWKIDTLATHLAQEGSPGPVVDPIAVSSTYTLKDVKEGARFAQEKAPTTFYSRWGTPTNRLLEKAVAALEGGSYAIATASGMGAISSALLAMIGKGSHIVSGKSLYTATTEMMIRHLPRFGVETSFVDPSREGAFEEAVKEGTSLIYLETPANPTMLITDISEAVRAAREVGAVVLADNTFATPINQRPLELGVDIVLHSATKYLGGHSDVIGGVIVTRERELFERIWETYKLLGPTLGAVDAFLISRGIRTLPLRVRRHNQIAQALAEFLEGHPMVSQVYYPGLRSFSQYDLARRQMKGMGGMLSIELKGGYDAAVALVEGLEVGRLAVSLGGVETLVEHAASMTHGPLTRKERRAAGIPEGLVRVSVGLEDLEDLKEDFDQALR
ncbi:MAG: aminotransferase class I/II-fold pyridoxal phosphate-dependent enzyme [Candidatus Thermoplasmatota archaeon]|nr:aminotransferase class I/II-fold pyridoxal phosphate-dependent enzyme [Candidatus Thermoplasmatota archaeon]